MPCIGFLKMLENRAKVESFNANILVDIEKHKKQLDKRIASLAKNMAHLRIMGNQYEAHKKQQLLIPLYKRLTHLDNVEQHMKELTQLLEA